MQVPLDDYPRHARFATELVNTAPEVMVSTGDGLLTADALVEFLHRHAIRPDALRAGPPTAADAAAVRALRPPLRDIIEAPDAERATRLAGELSLRCGTGLGLGRVGDGPWHWEARSRPDATLADELGMVAVVGLQAVLEALGHDRFRGCAAPTCHGVFVDTSRAGRRRYCEPAICGNRVNVARHRARRPG
jgi:predicted RNA-binding Zn ribbon-like protein